MADAFQEAIRGRFEQLEMIDVENTDIDSIIANIYSALTATFKGSIDNQVTLQKKKKKKKKKKWVKMNPLK